MADAGSLGQASVEIIADMSPYDRAMAELPARSRKQVSDAMKAIQKEMKSNAVQLSVAADPTKAGWKERIQELNAVQDQLQAKIAMVEQAAIREAEKVKQAAAAARMAAEAKKKQTQAYAEFSAYIASVTSQTLKLAQAERAEAVAAADQNQRFLRSAGSLTQVGAAAKSAGSAAGKSRGGFDNMGMGVLMVSQGVEDLQYGFSAIVNNIPMTLMAFGVSGGIAGAVSLAAVGVNVLYNNWDKLAGLFYDGIPQPALTGMDLLESKLAKAQTEMEALAKKTSLTWYELQKLGDLKVDIKGLKDAKEAQDAVDATLKGRSRAETDRGSGFGEAMAEVGGARANSEILGAFQDSKDEKGLVYNEVTGNLTTPEVAARDMTAAALKGDKISRDAIRKMLAGNSALGKAIDQSSPEKKKEIDQEKERAKNEYESDLRDEKKRHDQEKEADAKKEAKARQLDSDIDAASGGFQEKFGPEILAGIVKGQELSPKDLRPRVADQLTKSGYSQEDVERLSTGIAIKTVEDVTRGAQTKASAEGTTVEEGAGRSLREQTAGAMDRAGGGSGGFGSLDSFFQNLQAGVGNGNPMEEAVLKEARTQSDYLKKLYDETVKGKNKPADPGRAVGPA